MSAHLQWMVMQNRSSFLIKGNKQMYNPLPNNLKARNSFFYDGMINHKTVGMEPEPANCKGVVVVIRQRSGQRKPATSYVQTNKNAQATLSSICHKNKNIAAIHRTSAILRSQKPVMVKRRHAGTTKSCLHFQNIPSGLDLPALQMYMDSHECSLSSQARSQKSSSVRGVKEELVEKVAFEKKLEGIEEVSNENI
ncbi:LOW QUALITY PROTEIN: 60S ribosomal protein L28-like [Panthera pardus]|uniref:Large ribosomal subunit protein eL28 n=1 Tax=Panthera pardus TaxID=9691 RepID=A0A9W2UEZ6_PANPR|nr:LOW QUALITY PROTEIN: 60S ribosomal protein L28-like [Panthera pardus]